MVLAGMFYAALTTVFDVDTGVDKVVAAMSDDLPQVVCVLWPPLARDRDGEQDEYGAQCEAPTCNTHFCEFKFCQLELHYDACHTNGIG
jgi:hypothetical protein